jgi:hypothetical protein
VLASDAAHYYESYEQERTFAAVENVFLMHEGYRRLKALGPTHAHIVPGHDPLVLARYPAVSDALQGIAARLDVAPTL